jgi:23S rRNA (guanine2445-N2)-methyltransferase / 23S rRNA (guanine2069-N7)-methyltransferase
MDVVRFPTVPPTPRPLPAPSPDEPPRFTARTLEGLEWILARELEQVGAQDLRIGRRTIEFSAAPGAEKETLYRAVLESRTAIRVLEPLGRFRADSPDALYAAMQEVDWTEQLKTSDTLRVDAAIHDTFLTHSLYAAQIVKDAIVDQLRTPSGKRPSVQLRGATLRLGLHLVGDTATIFRDAAGRSLHQRGGRLGEVDAPLSEVLAAGILGITGWWRVGEHAVDDATYEPLLDPMCGSGTLVIEAATIAAGVAPGLYRARRKAHGFSKFRDCDRGLFDRLVAELEARVREPAGHFQASDLDPKAVEAAKACAEAAGVASGILIDVKHFEQARPAGENGLVVTNPPYGERLPLPRAAAFFRRFGDWLVQHCGGWRAAILAADTPAAGQLGLRPTYRVPLSNGPIACRLLEVEIRRRATPESSQVEDRGPAIASDAAAASRDRGEDGKHGAILPPRDNSHRPGADGAVDAAAASRGRGEDGKHGAILPPRDNAHRPSADGAVDASAASRGRGEDGEHGAILPPRDNSHRPGADGGNRVASGTSFPGRSRGRTTDDQIGDFRRRLAKRFKHLSKWARRQGIEAFRVYDRDIPEIPLVIDWYAGWLHAAEYERPHERTDIEHDVWLDKMIEAAALELGVPAMQTFLKVRRRQRDGGQYEKVDQRQAVLSVKEGDLSFEVNLSDYLDTGLFLDHRQTRAMVRDEAAGKRMLNLFCYTGSFSVYAAAGGAKETVSVDLSNTYLEWTRTNLAKNGFKDAGRHRIVRDEARAFLEHRANRGESPFDLVVVDPPTYSRSAKSETPWDVERDHAELLELVARNLSPGGIVYFSTNFRRFHLAEEQLSALYTLREITNRTIPEDFRNERIHRAWRLVKR